MKLDRIAILAVLTLSACSGTARRPAATAPVSTTGLTSAEIGEANAPVPRVGKATHSAPMSDVKRDREGSPSSPSSPKKGDVFGDWK